MAQQNLALAVKNNGGNGDNKLVPMEGVGGGEVSSNLSRSSSESGYKNLYKGGNVTNSNNNLNLKKGGAESSISSRVSATTPDNFQPFGEDVSSLGSLKEIEDADDEMLVNVVPMMDDGGGGIIDTTNSEGPVVLLQCEESSPSLLKRSSRDLSDQALNVHPTLSAETEQAALIKGSLSAIETPPKDNLSGNTVNNNKLLSSSPRSGCGRATVLIGDLPFPVELKRSSSTQTPTRNIMDINNHHYANNHNDGGRQPSVNRLLPMGTGTAPSQYDKAGTRVNVDYSNMEQQGGGGGRGPINSNSAAQSNNNNVPPPLPKAQYPTPFPASPKPPSAIRVAYSPASGSGGGGVPRLPNNANKKAIFKENPGTTTMAIPNQQQRGSDGCLTRQSSNASSVASLQTNGGSSRIRLGVCAMDKKARSKPMSEILKRLDITTFEAVFFGDDIILNESVENWPICDVLIAFYSNGYPLEKAEQYVSLRQPFLLNDLKMQRTLMDRRRVYDLLEETGIDVPKHVFMSRDGYVSTGTGDGGVRDDNNEHNHQNSDIAASYGCPADHEPEIDEHDDHIEVNGVVINKPFVEKPVDADDHNIAIYYPSSAGGGCKKLFRKVGDRSSEFYPEINDVRRDGSYIYEEFIETQGTDVKMYTVGPDYGHAEARKSPVVDGKVERNADGKEVRFPVILTLREKEIARRIVLVFKQQVCGFDILRIQEGDSLVSYVCDVNGWSFVKHSRKYYDDCAQILTEHMLAALKPKSKVSFSALAPLLATMEDPIDYATGGKPRKKKSRNRGASQSIADRVKMMLMGENNNTDQSGQDDDSHSKDEENDKVSDLQGSDDIDSSIHEQVPLHVTGDTYEEPVDFITNPVRNLPDQLATEPASSASIAPSGASSLADVDDLSMGGVAPSTHLEELRCVITIVRHGDRTPKQKLKDNIGREEFLQYFYNHTKKVKKDIKIKAKKDMVQFLTTVNTVISDLEAEGRTKENHLALYKARHIRDILQRWKFSGLNRKLQMKPRKWVEEESPDGDTSLKCSELQLIVKWGGDLTKLGEKQAVQLGNRLRNELYPSNKDGGILRLHSTFRHDLKIKTSDEGRVMKTAAAFAKGMLELEGDIPPILVSLVHKEQGSRHMVSKHVVNSAQ